MSEKKKSCSSDRMIDNCSRLAEYYDLPQRHFYGELNANIGVLLQLEQSSLAHGSCFLSSRKFYSLKRRKNIFIHREREKKTVYASLSVLSAICEKKGGSSDGVQEQQLVVAAVAVAAAAAVVAVAAGLIKQTLSQQQV